MSSRSLKLNPNYYFIISHIKISSLKGHEKTESKRLINLKKEIKSDGMLRKPIAVDINTDVILDGHHRIEALKLLGCSTIPVLFVDYNSPKIGVKRAYYGEELSKQKVIDAAFKGELLPPKSTWHYFKNSNKIDHISKLQKKMNIKLTELR